MAQNADLRKPRNGAGGSPSDQLPMHVDQTNSDEEPLGAGLPSSRSPLENEANSGSLDSEDYNQFGN